MTKRIEKEHRHACEGCENYKPVTYTLPRCEKTAIELMPGDYVSEKPEWCPLNKLTAIKQLR